MIALELKFLTGKYHATPWGRNVNEGEVEWPISIFRLSRGIIDVWKRRFPELASSRIERILSALATPPYFHLPPAATSHTRSYLSSNEKDSTAKQKIFDAFVTVERNTPLYMLFHDNLDAEDRNTLDLLLRHLNYIGRSESWISVRLLDSIPDVIWNCRPVWSNIATTSPFVTVPVTCLSTIEHYNNLPLKPERRPWQAAENGEGDCSWLEALCLNTADLLSDGWSDPPAMAWVNYSRNINALTVRPKQKKNSTREIRFVKYAVQSNVLPLIEDTVIIAERIRAAVMSRYKKCNGGNPSDVSASFSGKDKNGSPLTGHDHAFYLPVDEDGDGRIDHVIVHARQPFTTNEIMALDSLRTIWQPNGAEPLRFIMTSTSSSFCPIRSKKWVSVTPFVTSRHYKKNCGSYEKWLLQEVSLECQYNGLPLPNEIKPIPHTFHTIQPKHWWSFKRRRKGGIPLEGHGFILEFEEPVAGGFTIGTFGHFGLGMFMPYSD